MKVYHLLFIFSLFFFVSFAQTNCINKLSKVKKAIEKNEKKGFDALYELEALCTDDDFCVKVGDLYFQYEKYDKASRFYYKNWSFTYGEEILFQFLYSCVNSKNYELIE